MVHRNCNHFTETFATAIILKDSLAEPGTHKLKFYPDWINRLANTSKAVVGHDEDIVPCNPLEEARKAVGADQKVGWDFGHKDSKKDSKRKSSQKKELTEKQKAALAKIRGGKK